MQNFHPDPVPKSRTCACCTGRCITLVEQRSPRLRESPPPPASPPSGSAAPHYPPHPLHNPGSPPRPRTTFSVRELVPAATDCTVPAATVRRGSAGAGNHSPANQAVLRGQELGLRARPERLLREQPSAHQVREARRRGLERREGRLCAERAPPGAPPLLARAPSSRRAPPSPGVRLPRACPPPDVCPPPGARAPPLPVRASTPRAPSSRCAPPLPARPPRALCAPARPPPRRVPPLPARAPAPLAGACGLRPLGRSVAVTCARRGRGFGRAPAGGWRRTRSVRAGSEPETGRAAAAAPSRCRRSPSLSLRPRQPQTPPSSLAGDRLAAAHLPSRPHR